MCLRLLSEKESGKALRIFCNSYNSSVIECSFVPMNNYKICFTSTTVLYDQHVNGKIFANSHDPIDFFIYVFIAHKKNYRF